MKIKISLLTATKNSQETIEKTLLSAKNLVNEIIVVDNLSKDQTINIAKKYTDKIFFYNGDNLGKQYQWGLTKATNQWVLILDSDEYLSTQLKSEITNLIKNNKINNYDGYFIPFQNYFLGKQIKYGGENYQMLRLFKKDKVIITSEKIHQKYLLKTKKVGYLKGKIIHHSYRGLLQILQKFTYYAKEEAKQKYQNQEKITFKKLFLYGPHMFYARYIKDKGYKDGLFRILLDLLFSYMEGLTYWLLYWFYLKNFCKKFLRR